MNTTKTTPNDCQQETDGDGQFTERQLKKQRELQGGVDDYAERAHGIAWDGCHKIYLLMDDEQVKEMRGHGYGTDDTALVTSNDASHNEMRGLVHGWFEASCGLRFISAVATVQDNPNEGFTSLISQEDGWEFFIPDDDTEEEV